MRSWKLWLGALAAACAMQVAAQAPAKDSFVIAHPWVVPPPNAKPEAYFLDLKDGDKIETPFILRFGLSLRGLAPAEFPAGLAGHHHLLIDYPIPPLTGKPLPFTDQYIHFGKGEMQTILKLKPGTYTLALLLSDENHVPYPVHSQPIRVTVTKFDPAVNIWKLWGEPRIEIRSPADGAAVKGPFRVNFHASAYNIAVATARLDTNHFRLSVEPRGKRAEVLDFTLGQTEVWLNPPKGEYTLKLDLLSNTQPGKVMTSAPPVKLTVN